MFFFACCVFVVRVFSWISQSSKAASLTQAYHRYTLNYNNALNYLETLRRQVEFNEFEKVCAISSFLQIHERSVMLISHDSVQNM